MLKPLVKRGLFFSIEKGFLPHKIGTLDFGGNFTPRNQLTTKTRFWVQRAPSQSLPGKLEVRSRREPIEKSAQRDTNLRAGTLQPDRTF